jgi:hypothetical protein
MPRNAAGTPTSKVVARPYLSPTLVLLCFDWADGANRQDFLGFAIKRAPGYQSEKESWLPNRVGFDGPAPNHGDVPCNTAPFQKFMWWDARIDDVDRGKTFTYTIYPAVGDPAKPDLLDDASVALPVTLPQSVIDGVGTYFNRAVVSSQAFVKEFGTKPTGQKWSDALDWLSNGLAPALAGFASADTELDGVIYHLTDDHWIIPALKARQRPTSFVYEAAKSDKGINDPAVAELTNVTFAKRTHTSIMHDKYLVQTAGGKAKRLQTGSANYTTEGLTIQANVIHTFESEKLADLYKTRKALLEPDPSLLDTAKHAGWSDAVKVGAATIRVFFPPEPKDQRVSIDTIVDAVKAATSSAVFCIFDPTDQALRDALFAIGDQGKMMFGLVNSIDPEADTKPVKNSADQATVDIYHRSRDKKDTYSYAGFAQGNQPQGFWWETARLPGVPNKNRVFIHHKFVVIDAETDSPTIYTGSANMSNNSMHNNDENLLEIKGDTALARTYLAEFMRLYEHYRARALWQEHPHQPDDTLKLKTTSIWAKNAYAAGMPEFRARKAMVGEA